MEMLFCCALAPRVDAKTMDAPGSGAIQALAREIEGARVDGKRALRRRARLRRERDLEGQRIVRGRVEGARTGRLA